MLVERTRDLISAGKLEVDRRAAQLDSPGLHGRNERASYTVATPIMRDAEITQPQALFTRMRFKSTAE